VPFKSARATHSGRPTRLADGLELESTPTRNGESSPRQPRSRWRVRLQWFPRFRTCRAELGYTFCNYTFLASHATRRGIGAGFSASFGGLATSIAHLKAVKCLSQL
jgi:hypothetical protein